MILLYYDLFNSNLPFVGSTSKDYHSYKFTLLLSLQLVASLFLQCCLPKKKHKFILHFVQNCEALYIIYR